MDAREIALSRRRARRVPAYAFLSILGVGAFVSFGTSDAEAQQEMTPVGDWSPAQAAAYLDGRRSWWQDWPNAARDHDTACVSCHTTLPYALARPALRTALGEHGPSTLETRLVGDVQRRVTLWHEVAPYYPDQTVGLPKTSESRGTEAILNVVILAHRDARTGQLAIETRRAFENLWTLQFKQREGAGGWAWLNFGLAPWESDGAAYFGAALAAVAVGVAPQEYAASSDIEESLDLLRAYLRAGLEDQPPYDRVMLLWAASELSDLLTDAETESALEAVMSLQNTDGGWSLSSLRAWEREDGQPQSSSSDGYATGLVAFVLQRAGVPAGDVRLNNALGWLVENQGHDGQWRATSLNRDRDPESDRGRFMDDAATGFSVLALTERARSHE